jgi:nudix-type nucleoside diphosphatase (YffH/AdpP family)
LELVLGYRPEGLCNATLDDHAVYVARKDGVDQAFPMIAPVAGEQAQGLYVPGLTDADMARLDFYEGGFAYDLHPVAVQSTPGTPATPRKAQVYMPLPDQWERGAPWSLAVWQTDWAATTMGAAQEVMARYGTDDARDLRPLMPFIRSRAWGQVLGRTAAPTPLRRQPALGDLELIADSRPAHRGFFNLRPFSLRYRKFSGDFSAVLPREVLESFDVALVLPYDPALDKVMLIEQLRYGPIHRGDPAPWVLEPVAGLVDAGETPQQAARREAIEEAGLELSDLLPAVAGYSSPGYSTEFFHCFIGICDLSGRSQEQGGLDVENEDIRNHTIAFDQAMALIASGEINAAPLAMLLYAVAAKREVLRAAS